MTYDDLKARLAVLRSIELSDDERTQLQGDLTHAIASGRKPASWRRATRRRRYRDIAALAGLCAALLVGVGVASNAGLFHPNSAVSVKAMPKPDLAHATSVLFLKMPSDLQVVARAVGDIYGIPDVPGKGFTFANLDMKVQKTTAVGDSATTIYVITLPGAYNYRAPDGRKLHANQLVFNMSDDGKEVWNLRASNSAADPVLWTAQSVAISQSQLTFTGASAHWTGELNAFNVTASISEENNFLRGTDGVNSGTFHFLGNPSSIHGKYGYKLSTGESFSTDAPLRNGMMRWQDDNYHSYSTDDGIDVTVTWNGHKETFTMEANT